MQIFGIIPFIKLEKQQKLQKKVFFSILPSAGHKK